MGVNERLALDTCPRGGAESQMTFLRSLLLSSSCISSKGDRWGFLRVAISFIPRHPPCLGNSCVVSVCPFLPSERETLAWLLLGDGAVTRSVHLLPSRTTPGYEKSPKLLWWFDKYTSPSGCGRHDAWSKAEFVQRPVTIPASPLTTACCPFQLIWLAPF